MTDLIKKKNLKKELQITWSLQEPIWTPGHMIDYALYPPIFENCN